MVHEMYAIQDVKAAYFLNPWPCRHPNIARREFAEAVKNSNSPMSQFPADYVLYHVGDYDDTCARMRSLPTPERMCDGVEVLQMAAPVAVGEVSKNV